LNDSAPINSGTFPDVAVFNGIIVPNGAVGLLLTLPLKKTV